ncbi:hypothetical protein VE04_08130 [Pseudogymnoascus sp. 24MN13]|nr:hypothetical protein VE04_08130 [Pseudogymnoascus sp. 24MN13]
MTSITSTNAIEEETYDDYVAEEFYPAHIGEVIKSPRGEYEIIGKLGSPTSTPSPSSQTPATPQTSSSTPPTPQSPKQQTMTATCSRSATRGARPADGSSARAPTTITTASTAKEARRVLDWQRDVARSISSQSPTQSRDGSPERAMVLAQPVQEEAAPSQVAPPTEVPDARPALLRSATTPMMTAMYNEVSSALPERIGEGLSAQAIIGTILGAAAGAAVAYAMVRSEEPEPQRPQLVTYFSAPAAQFPQQAPVMEVARSKAPSMGGSRVGSERSQGGQRYVLRYNVASNAGTSRGGREGVLQPVDERRSMSYSAYDGGRSQAPAPSQASTAKQSRYTERDVGYEKPVTVVSASRHSEAGRHSESGRSHASKRSDSTIKPARTSSKAGTERRDQTVVSMKSDRKSTTVSERARRVRLPESVMGGSMAPSERARPGPGPRGA